MFDSRISDKNGNEAPQAQRVEPAQSAVTRHPQLTIYHHSSKESFLAGLKERERMVVSIPRDIEVNNPTTTTTTTTTTTVNAPIASQEELLGDNTNFPVNSNQNTTRSGVERGAEFLKKALNTGFEGAEEGFEPPIESNIYKKKLASSGNDLIARLYAFYLCRGYYTKIRQLAVFNGVPSRLSEATIFRYFTIDFESALQNNTLDAYILSRATVLNNECPLLFERCSGQTREARLVAQELLMPAEREVHQEKQNPPLILQRRGAVVGLSLKRKASVMDDENSESYECSTSEGSNEELVPAPKRQNTGSVRSTVTKPMAGSTERQSISTMDTIPFVQEKIEDINPQLIANATIEDKKFLHRLSNLLNRYHVRIKLSELLKIKVKYSFSWSGMDSDISKVLINGYKAGWYNKNKEPMTFEECKTLKLKQEHLWSGYKSTELNELHATLYASAYRHHFELTHLVKNKNEISILPQEKKNNTVEGLDEISVVLEWAKKNNLEDFAKMLFNQDKARRPERRLLSDYTNVNDALKRFEIPISENALKSLESRYINTKIQVVDLMKFAIFNARKNVRSDSDIQTLFSKGLYKHFLGQTSYPKEIEAFYNIIYAFASVNRYKHGIMYNRDRINFPLTNSIYLNGTPFFNTAPRKVTDRRSRRSAETRRNLARNKNRAMLQKSADSSVIKRKKKQSTTTVSITRPPMALQSMARKAATSYPSAAASSSSESADESYTYSGASVDQSYSDSDQSYSSIHNNERLCVAPTLEPSIQSELPHDTNYQSEILNEQAFATTAFLPLFNIPQRNIRSPSGTSVLLLSRETAIQSEPRASEIRSDDLPSNIVMQGAGRGDFSDDSCQFFLNPSP